MKTTCPHCNTVHATAQPSRRAVMVLIAVIAIAGGWTTGFFCGGILTRPNRQKVNAETATLKAQNGLMAADIERRIQAAEDYKSSPARLNPKLCTNLSAFCDCWADYCQLSTFDSLRGAIGAGENPRKFQFALECSVKVLGDRLAQIARRPPIEDEALRECSRRIVNAMIAEKELHLGFIEFMRSDMRGDFRAEELFDQREKAGWAAAKDIAIQRARLGFFE